MAGFEPEAAVLLEECRVAHLATIAEDGRPRMVPVCFAAVDGRVVISHDQKPKRRGALARFRDIARDPRVTLLADRYDDDWTKLAWVRVEGVLQPGVFDGAPLPILSAQRVTPVAMPDQPYLYP